jgi:hypothetical protein
LDARLTTLLCKKIIVAKSKEVKSRSNVAESSKEGYGSKSVVLLLLMIFFIDTTPFVDDILLIKNENVLQNSVYN